MGLSAVSKEGRLLGIPTALGKAVGPKGKSAESHSLSVSLFAKGINNTCLTHITGWLGRSNKTYLEALFQSTQHGYSLIPIMKC